MKQYSWFWFWICIREIIIVQHITCWSSERWLNNWDLHWFEGHVFSVKRSNVACFEQSINVDVPSPKGTHGCDVCYSKTGHKTYSMFVSKKHTLQPERACYWAVAFFHLLILRYCAKRSICSDLFDLLTWLTLFIIQRADVETMTWVAVLLQRLANSGVPYALSDHVIFHQLPLARPSKKWNRAFIFYDKTSLGLKHWW